MVVAGVWIAPSGISPNDELALGYWGGYSSEDPEPSESGLGMSGCSMVDMCGDHVGVVSLLSDRGVCGGAVVAENGRMSGIFPPPTTDLPICRVSFPVRSLVPTWFNLCPAFILGPSPGLRSQS
jgi:hypothetical protein